MARNLTMEDALYTVFLANGHQIVYIAPLAWAKKTYGLLETPSGKIASFVLENDFRLHARCEYISSIVIRPHNFDPEIEKVPRAEEFKVKEVKTVGEFGEDL